MKQAKASKPKVTGQFLADGVTPITTQHLEQSSAGGLASVEKAQASAPEVAGQFLADGVTPINTQHLEQTSRGGKRGAKAQRGKPAPKRKAGADAVNSSQHPAYNKAPIVVVASYFDPAGAKHFRERGDWEAGQKYDVEGQGLHSIQSKGIKNGKKRYSWAAAADG
eukprot:COSAG04_NODE_10710_length_757_cov_1.800912_2_plen_165_part_01